MQTLFYFLLWGAFFFVMMRFGCGAHVMGHGHAHPGRTLDSVPSPGGNVLIPTKATDPVCGMVIDTAGARTAVQDGQAFYFCSQSCREKFEAAPTTYFSRVSDTLQKMEPGHDHQH